MHNCSVYGKKNGQKVTFGERGDEWEILNSSNQQIMLHVISLGLRDYKIQIQINISVPLFPQLELLSPPVKLVPSKVRKNRRQNLHLSIKTLQVYFQVKVFLVRLLNSHDHLSSKKVA